MSHWCLAVSLCQSFVLCWRKRRAAASKYEWLESSDLNVSTHKHGHSLENNMVCIHTCTESTLCNSVGSAGFVDSICSAPRHLPFAPHPLWQVEGIQTQKLRRHTLNSTDTWLVFRLHTHTLIYTHLLWCRATVPHGARQAEQCVACLYHLLLGQTEDEGLDLTAHRRTATYSRQM